MVDGDDRNEGLDILLSGSPVVVEISPSTAGILAKVIEFMLDRGPIPVARRVVALAGPIGPIAPRVLGHIAGLTVVNRSGPVVTFSGGLVSGQATLLPSIAVAAIIRFRCHQGHPASSTHDDGGGQPSWNE